MRSLTITVLTFLMILSCLTTSAQNFSITGTLSGSPDSTWLYLSKGEELIDIDSTKVINNQFHFTGKINSLAEHAALHTKGFKDYTFFWLENSNISISAKAGELKKAKVKGSTLQDDDNTLKAIEQPIIQREDSINSAYKITKDTTERKTLAEAFSNARNDEMSADIDFVKSHPNSVISAYLLNVYSRTWKKATTIILYNGLSAEIKKSAYCKDVKDFIELNRDVSIGRKFVDFAEPDQNGKLIKLSELKGKYIFLDFWASWCGPCRAENPNLVKVYNAYKNKGFLVLGISLDENKTQWLDAIKHDGLVWQNVSDLKGDKNQAAIIYGISGIPDNFLIDDKGSIIARNLRGEDLEKTLSKLMPAPAR